MLLAKPNRTYPAIANAMFGAHAMIIKPTAAKDAVRIKGIIGLAERSDHVPTPSATKTESPKTIPKINVVWFAGVQDWF